MKKITKPESYQIRVLSRHDVTAEMMILRFERPAEFTFKPGQYCTLGIDGDERPYSIASAPHEPFIELFLELVPADLATPHSLTEKLWRLKARDEVWLRPQAKGGLVLQPQYDVHVLVSTATGVAPFVSMVRAYLHRSHAQPHGFYPRKFERIYVFQGASYLDEFGYDAELISATEADATVVYRRTVSQLPGLERDKGRNAGWTTDDKTRDVMRINRNLLWYFGQFGIGPERSCVYVCGNEGMVNDLAFGATRHEQARVSDVLPAGQLVKLGYTVRKEIYF